MWWINKTYVCQSKVNVISNLKKNSGKKSTHFCHFFLKFNSLVLCIRQVIIYTFFIFIYFHYSMEFYPKLSMALFSTCVLFCCQVWFNNVFLLSFYKALAKTIKGGCVSFRKVVQKVANSLATSMMCLLTVIEQFSGRNKNKLHINMKDLKRKLVGGVRILNKLTMDKYQKLCVHYCPFTSSLSMAVSCGKMQRQNTWVPMKLCRESFLRRLLLILNTPKSLEY